MIFVAFTAGLTIAVAKHMGFVELDALGADRVLGHHFLLLLQ